MRAGYVSLVLLLPLLSGCLSSDPNLGAGPLQIPDLDVSGMGLPETAVVEKTAQGVLIQLGEIALPFNTEFQIPEGTTMVRWTADVASGPVSTSLANADTGRRRCNSAPVDNGWVNREGSMTCSGLTAMDELPAVWRFAASSGLATAKGTIELLATPPDGLVSGLDLSQLSKPTHELQDTVNVQIPSKADGEIMFGELTLPTGDGPWPTIISSSPYNGGDHLVGRATMWNYFVHDWAKRGYAVLSADVRGTGYSGGCMEVWGPNEQLDQVSLVEWAAAQSWSDGNVGFYGQSYVATTPVAAASYAPEALKAIIAVAPVINAYEDWHFGGVPNGENAASPSVGYQAGTGALDKTPINPNDPQPDDVMYHVNDPTSLTWLANGVCDPTLTLRANDPRAIYDAFYQERDFKTIVQNIEAAVLYTQGFEDSNVKSAMIPGWFNEIQSPKLGLFGHWVHQHPTRMDQEALFLAWMDEYVKGKPIGFENVANVDVLDNLGRHRTADAWPSIEAEESFLYLDDQGGWGRQAPGEGTLTLTTAPEYDPLGALPDTDLWWESEATEPVTWHGTGHLRIVAHLTGAENAHVAAWLYDQDASGELTEVTFGMINLAHRNGHDQYAPVTPDELVTVDLPLLPTEYTVAEGHSLVLHMRSTHVQDWFLTNPVEPGQLLLHTGPDGLRLELPMVDGQTYQDAPLTALT